MVSVWSMALLWTFLIIGLYELRAGWQYNEKKVVFEQISLVYHDLGFLIRSFLCAHRIFY